MGLVEWVWVGLDVLAVGAMTGEPGVEMFQLFQAIQLLEIPILLMRPTFHMWLAFYILNIPIEALALAATDRYKWARLAMAVHVGLKIWQTRDMDCDWQFALGPLYYLIANLNKLIILLLLAYTLPSAFQRIKETYHARSEAKASRRSSHPRTSPARAA